MTLSCVFILRPRVLGGVYRLCDQGMKWVFDVLNSPADCLLNPDGKWHTSPASAGNCKEQVPLHFSGDHQQLFPPCPCRTQKGSDYRKDPIIYSGRSDYPIPWLLHPFCAQKLAISLWRTLQVSRENYLLSLVGNSTGCKGQVEQVK